MWVVLTVERFDEWFLALSESEQISILTTVKLLEAKGPSLGRPHVDTLEGTKYVKNLKELRIQHQGKPYRVFFAFDPDRQAILLCGGDKTGMKRFYETMIPIAEQELLNHLSTID
jgi:hypothetical protein